MSKNNRQSISFPQAVYDKIRALAIKQGYTVGAGRDSQIAKCVEDNLFPDDEYPEGKDEQGV